MPDIGGQPLSRWVCSSTILCSLAPVWSPDCAGVGSVSRFCAGLVGTGSGTEWGSSQIIFPSISPNGQKLERGPRPVICPLGMLTMNAGHCFTRNAATAQQQRNGWSAFDQVEVAPIVAAVCEQVRYKPAHD